MSHRIDDLLGMRVIFADANDDSHGSGGDQVTDVRLAHGDRVRGTLSELVVDGFIIGRRGPGTLLGYDRHPSMGPWLLRVAVRALHRRTGYVDWQDVEQVDWDSHTLRLRVDTPRPLRR
jgi:hypothetical protein